MADIKEIAKDVGLTVVLGPVGRTASAIKKLIKVYKEKKAKEKDKKLKDDFQKIIDDLKSEKHQEFLDNLSKHGKSVPLLPSTPSPDKEGYITIPNPRGEGTIKAKPMKKGGKAKASKYAKGGGVRKSKYSLQLWVIYMEARVIFG